MVKRDLERDLENGLDLEMDDLEDILFQPNQSVTKVSKPNNQVLIKAITEIAKPNETKPNLFGVFKF